jgi:hypothetical protein
MASTIRRYKEQPKKSSGKKWTLLALILLLLSATAAWAMRTREDPKVAHIKEMQAQFEQLPREERREKGRELWKEIEELTPEQRDAVFAERRAEWMKREKEHLKEFFAMTKEQQVAALDKEIDRMRERAKNGKGRGGRGGGGGPGGGGGGGPQFGRDGNGNVGASDRTKGYLNRSSGDTRGASYEYRRMMNDRMRQRGL